jgi:hypothetical protein
VERYLKWTSIDILNLFSKSSINVLYTEVDSDGKVLREIGVDVKGIVVHKFPSDFFPDGRYGFFDLQRIQTPLEENQLQKEAFEKLWNKGEGCCFPQ